ncbi:DEHA2E21868p [Debaryomyces hansenii CBS767]|uniref:DEHA2E21868p n=1 Tax=Debaryomyces hansenii (strain ATCC 36239 / CBS 767 / BCRC 21394 / JCM 1990 / NBRC 0083 / IGC 2968) TaxID=284592 RepID=Q6BNG8_DEBHA|nr:DEHA2E21868p [Debaryomyces hansenii CBS767]CAG88528.2 DEHA2E21868p [Debaryomyces hansenii CBS767]|eukprot:XP_460252.2 DEHA2E21868p [Debaryomyces hansenii CBS767]
MPLGDVKLNSDLRNVRCPLCHKPELYYNDLICSNCNNNELELIRNSCIENDSINDIARNKINTIFSTCQDVKDLKGIELPPEISNETPQPSINAMKSLALQLIKLDILNTNLKIKNIDKTQELLDARTNELKNNIQIIQTKLDTKQERLDSTCSKLFNNFEETNDSLNAKIQEYKFEKINQIKKQSIQLQYNNYKILKEMIFTSNNSKSANLNYITKLKASSSRNLLFHNRSILNINEFFSCNNKLPQINEFLENLIKLQVHLQDIFNMDSFSLPYLEELIGYLPDSKFYDMIQEKENFMINGGKLSSDEIEDAEEEKNSTVQEMKADNERVIKLGNTIKLPLSSKTINSQLRRASLNKEDASSSSKPNEVEKITPKKAPSPIRSTLSGKKMIILPHKILTKPFTKLTAKEYLKFLSIIVKILFNFKTFFYFTIDSIPNLRKQSSMLSNTMNPFRNNSEDRNFSSSFEKILEKVASMDRYFSHKLSRIQNAKSSDEKYDMSSSNLSSSNAGTFKSFNTHSTSTSNANYDFRTPSSNPNSTHSLNSSAVVTQRNGKVKQFYSKQKPNDHEIYGNFSESKDNMGSPVYSYDADNDLMNESELKTIMQDVYKLMASGTSRSRNSELNDKSKNLDFNAINMIAQSKVQLDEWDVVSKMY